jgi:hypothetical protein
MFQDWSRLIMNEEDKYTGVMFAAINKRANLVAQLALESLRTDAMKTIMEKAKAKGVFGLKHGSVFAGMVVVRRLRA